MAFSGIDSEALAQKIVEQFQAAQKSAETKIKRSEWSLSLDEIVQLKHNGNLSKGSQESIDNFVSSVSEYAQNALKKNNAELENALNSNWSELLKALSNQKWDTGAIREFIANYTAAITKGIESVSKNKDFATIFSSLFEMNAGQAKGFADNISKEVLKGMKGLQKSDEIIKEHNKLIQESQRISSQKTPSNAQDVKTDNKLLNDKKQALANVNKQLEEQTKKYEEASRAIDEYNRKYEDMASKHEKYKDTKSKTGTGMLVDNDNLKEISEIGRMLKSKDWWGDSKLKQADFKESYDSIMRIIELHLKEYSTGQFGLYKEASEFYSRLFVRDLETFMNGFRIDSNGNKFKQKYEAASVAEIVRNIVREIERSYDFAKETGIQYTPMEKQSDYKSLQAEREANDQAYNESVARREELWRQEAQLKREIAELESQTAQAQISEQDNIQQKTQETTEEMQHQYAVIKNIVDRMLELRQQMGNLKANMPMSTASDMRTALTGERSPIQSGDMLIEEMKKWTNEYITAKQALESGEQEIKSKLTGQDFTQEYLNNVKELVQQLGIVFAKDGGDINSLSKKIKGGLYTSIKEAVDMVSKGKAIHLDLDNLITIDDSIIQQTRKFINGIFNKEWFVEGRSVEEIMNRIFKNSNINSQIEETITEEKDLKKETDLVTQAFEQYRKYTEDYNSAAQDTEEIVSRLISAFGKLRNATKKGTLNEMFEEQYASSQNLSDKFLNDFIKRLPKNKSDISKYINSIVSGFDSSARNELFKVMNYYQGDFNDPDMDIFNNLTSKVSKQKASYLSVLTSKYIEEWENFEGQLVQIKSEVKPIIQELLNALNIKDYNDWDIGKLLNDNLFATLEGLYSLKPSDFLSDPINSIRKVFDWNNYIKADYFNLIDIKEIDTVDKLIQKMNELKITAQEAEKVKDEAYLSWIEAKYNNPAAEDNEYQRYKILENETQELWKQYGAYECLSRIVETIQNPPANQNSSENFQFINSQLDEINTKSVELSNRMAQMFANMVMNGQSENYYTGLLDDIQAVEAELNELRNRQNNIQIPDGHETFMSKSNGNVAMFGNVQALIDQQKANVHRIYDAIDFETQRAQQELEAKQSARQNEMMQRILSTEGWNKVSGNTNANNLFVKYLDIARTSEQELDGLYTEFLSEYNTFKTELENIEAEEERVANRRSEIRASLTQFSNQGYSNWIVDYQKEIEEAAQSTETLENRIDSLMSKIASEKGLEYKSKISSGTTAPLQETKQELELINSKEDEVISKTQTMYRAFNSKHGISGNGISWFGNDLENVGTYLDNINTSKDKIAELTTDISKFFVVDAQGSHWGEIMYDGVSHTADELAEIAKQAGYAGIAIQNVWDSYNGVGSGNLGTTFAIFDENIVNNAVDNTDQLKSKLSELDSIQKHINETLHTFDGRDSNVWEEAKESFKSVVLEYKNGSITIEDAFNKITESANNILSSNNKESDFKNKVNELWKSLKSNSKFSNDIYKNYSSSNWKTIVQDFVDGVKTEEQAIQELETEFKNLLELESQPNKNGVSSSTTAQVEAQAEALEHEAKAQREVNEAKADEPDKTNISSEVEQTEELAAAEEKVTEAVKKRYSYSEKNSAPRATRKQEIADIENLGNELDKASQKAEYFLKQIGKIGDEHYSTTKANGFGQTEITSYSQIKDDDGNLLYKRNGEPLYAVQTQTITDFETLKKLVYENDEEIIKLTSDIDSLSRKGKDTSGLETNLKYLNQYNDLLEEEIIKYKDSPLYASNESEFKIFEAVREAKKAMSENLIDQKSSDQMSKVYDSAIQKASKLKVLQDELHNKILLEERGQNRTEVISALNNQLDTLNNTYNEVITTAEKFNVEGKDTSVEIQKLAQLGIDQNFTKYIDSLTKIEIKEEEVAERVAQREEDIAKKTQANIEKTNADLLKLREAVKDVEYNYNTDLNPAAKKGIDNSTSDFNKLQDMRNEILQSINRLQMSNTNNASSESWFIQEKARLGSLIKEYSRVAKAKQEINNPIEKSLSGQELDTAVDVLINKYKELISIATKPEYFNTTQKISLELKKQLSLLEQNKNANKNNNDDYNFALSIFKSQNALFIQEKDNIDATNKSYEKSISLIKREQAEREAIIKIQNNSKKTSEQIKSEIKFHRENINQISREISEEEAYRLKNQLVNQELEKRLAIQKQNSYYSINSLNDSYGENQSYKLLNIEKELLNLEKNKSDYIDIYSEKLNEIINSVAAIKNKWSEISNIQKEDLLKDIDAKIKDFKSSSKNYISKNVNGELITSSFGKVTDINDLENALKKYLSTIGQTTSDIKIQGNTAKAVYRDQAKGCQEVTASIDKQTNSMRVLIRTQSSSMTFLKAWGNTTLGIGKTLLTYYGGQQVLTRLLSKFREGISTLKEFDAALTNISYTMDIDSEQLENLGNSAIDLANDLGMSLQNAMQIYQIYANMNTTVEEIQETARPTAILSNLSGVTADKAADQVQGILQQFELLKGKENEVAEESMHVVDVLDKISSNVAIDYAKGISTITDAVTATGQVAHDAGMTYEELAAISAKVAERTREDGSSIGNAIKTMITRITKVSKMPQYEDEIDSEAVGKAAKALEDINIQVYDAQGNYRNMTQILTELNNVWDTLNNEQQSYIAFQIAATRQGSKFKTMLSSWVEGMQLAEEATNAQGNAEKNQEKYLNSYTGRLQELKTAWDTFTLDLLNSDAFKNAISALTELVVKVNELSNAIGTPLTLAIAGIGGSLAKTLVSKDIVKVYKNFGRVKMFTLYKYAES